MLPGFSTQCGSANAIISKLMNCKVDAVLASSLCLFVLSNEGYMKQPAGHDVHDTWSAGIRKTYILKHLRKLIMTVFISTMPCMTCEKITHS